MEILVLIKKIADIKRSTDFLNRVLNTIEDRIREWEDITVENSLWQEKNAKCNKEHNRCLEYNTDVYILVTEVQSKRERENGAK